ncbi:MAG: sugar ABC transporter ATP-binding protein [Lachnospiraceae bacterium]|nr:sugar ABC transporter ATP-binding protein [Lachnospiraceae bacterium]
MDHPILELRNITKEYPGVVALDDVSLAFRRGEVHAICGENGAGKSTFIKVITGAIQPTHGEIWFEGERLENNNPHKALSIGISAIYQELNLLKHLTVAENIYYNRYPYKNGLIDYRKMEENARQVLDRLGVRIDPKMLVRDLTVGYQQLVEIAKSVSRTIKVLILDEPSAPLTNNELKYLFDIVRAMREENMAIIYISHRLEEVFLLCDKVSIFRDGHFIRTLNVSETNQQELIRLMVNRELTETYPKAHTRKGEVVLEVNNLSTGLLRNVSFKAYRGERLGFAGLVGAGRTETARAVFGADRIESGEIILNGKQVKITSPADAIRHGIVYLSEDRKQLGLFLNMSILDNILFSYLPNLQGRSGLLDLKSGDKICQKQIETLAIKTPSARQLVRNLSGGNQQKVIIAKWLLLNCDVIFFDEPTRGIDVGAKQEIYRLMNELTEQGKCVIMISSEMPELLGMSDRIIVMHEGEVVGELSGAEASQEEVLRLASGA